MYRHIDDFIKDWNYEREATARVFRAITDGSLHQRVNEQGREIGRLATHITESISEMLHRAGLKFEGTPDHAQTPEHASEIVEQYETTAQSATDAILAQWTDAQLTDEVEMYGQQWAKGTVLMTLITHQTHHRGQLTVLMRQAGLRVPGVYGPAREDWASMGMPAMA